MCWRRVSIVTPSQLKWKLKKIKKKLSLNEILKKEKRLAGRVSVKAPKYILSVGHKYSHKALCIHCAAYLQILGTSFMCQVGGLSSMTQSQTCLPSVQETHLHVLTLPSMLHMNVVRDYVWAYSEILNDLVRWLPEWTEGCGCLSIWPQHSSPGSEKNHDIPHLAIGHG
jgi:hypothetical protein